MSSTSSHHLLHLLLFSCFLIVSARPVNVKEPICPFQSIYKFGDSISDTGNAIRMRPFGPTLASAHLPYGETFPGRPTGRWSNGLLIIDFQASAFHLPPLHPYLDRTASFEFGANFAVGGASALDQSFFAASAIQVAAPLGVQLRWFQDFLNSTCQTPIECSRRLRRSLVFVGEIGSNDLRYLQAEGKSILEIQTYIPQIVTAIIDAVREVIRLGAVRIVVPGTFAVGCFPAALTAFRNNDPTAYDDFGCLTYVNDLVQLLNNNLQESLDMLGKEFPDVVILYADNYSAFYSILNRAPFLGFDPTTLLKACCGVGGSYNYDSNRACGSTGVPVCPNPARYISWDGLHLTQEAYRRIYEIIIADILAKIQCVW